MADKEYRVGRSVLLMPSSHKLDEHRARYKLYDRALPEIVRAISGKYPGLTAIDIGANVGDSAALICQYQDIPVLCVEGSPFFLEYLRRNLSRLAPTVEIFPALIGRSSGSISPEAVQVREGTATVDVSVAMRPGARGPRDIAVRSLSDILRENPRFAHPKFIKSDTDGSDFEIISSSRDVIAASRPVIFFEFDPTFRKDGVKAALQAIALLEEVGYRSFLVYDNFGNMMSFIEEDASVQFENLCLYILSHALTGRQIYYVDVCAFTSEDADIAIAVYDHHLDGLEEAIRASGWELP